MLSGRLAGDRGASAVEYALIVAVVAVILLPALIGLRNVLFDVAENSCQQTARQNGFTQAEIDTNVAACERP